MNSMYIQYVYIVNIYADIVQNVKIKCLYDHLTVLLIMFSE